MKHVYFISVSEYIVYMFFCLVGQPSTRKTWKMYNCHDTNTQLSAAGARRRGTSRPEGGGGGGRDGVDFTWRTGWGKLPSNRTDPWPRTERTPGWRRRTAAASETGSWKEDREHEKVLKLLQDEHDILTGPCTSIHPSESTYLDSLIFLSLFTENYSREFIAPFRPLVDYRD